MSTQTFTSATEVHAYIATAIEASGADCATGYDLEGIGAAVTSWVNGTLTLTAEGDEFWNAVVAGQWIVTGDPLEVGYAHLAEARAELADLVSPDTDGELAELLFDRAAAIIGRAWVAAVVADGFEFIEVADSDRDEWVAAGRIDGDRVASADVVAEHAAGWFDAAWENAEGVEALIAAARVAVTA